MAKAANNDHGFKMAPDKALQLLKKQLTDGQRLQSAGGVTLEDMSAWTTTVVGLLTRIYGADYPTVQTFKTAHRYAGGIHNEQQDYEWRKKAHRKRVKMIEGAIEEIAAELTIDDNAKPQVPSVPNEGVFLVHGHDEAVIHECARFLEKINHAPTILREQPNSGRTIIEKFIDYSGVGFAVILLTGDDRGGPKTIPNAKQKPRARQNVILEMGFFIGKLGRERVCVLYDRGVEIPSDYHGVLYLELDPKGLWKYELAKEMKAIGYSIDMNKAF